MGWLIALREGVTDRLKMPAWHLLWVVILLAATPWLRHEIAQEVASASRLTQACTATAGCRKAELVYARTAASRLTALPTRVLASYVVVVSAEPRAATVAPGVLERLAESSGRWKTRLAITAAVDPATFDRQYVRLGDGQIVFYVMPLMVYLCGLLPLTLLAARFAGRWDGALSAQLWMLFYGSALTAWQLLSPWLGRFSYVGTLPVDLMLIGMAGTVHVAAMARRHHRQARGATEGGSGRREREADASDTSGQIESPAQPRAARHNFDQVIGMDALKAQLLEAGQEILGLKRTEGAVRNGILLHGEPGNGKTFFAEALAGQLGLPIMEARVNEISSRWVGQSTEQLVAIFREARRRAPLVLLLDEVDSILVDRASLINGDSEAGRLVNALLTETVDLRGRKVVLVAATNFLNRLDAAAIREGRFDYKILVAPPDDAARRHLLSQALQRATVEPDALERFSRRSEGFSIARLRAIGSEAARRAGRSGRVDFALLQASLRAVQGTRRRLAESTPGLEDLVLDPQLRQTLRGLASRMRDVERIERLGGTVPQGALFFGPPGTGKTAAVRALAKDSGWVLIPTHGAELSADAKAIDRIIAEARDLRPSIVFIDEADAIVGHRMGSHLQSVTNAILIAMDGASGRAQDVLFIAATNHPDAVDEAALRRFTEKVQFAPPSLPELTDFAQRWLASTRARVAPDLDAPGIARELHGLTIALCQEAMKAAVNAMIARAADPEGCAVTLADVRRGRAVVAGG